MDRNYIIKITQNTPAVALRKESVDRNTAIGYVMYNSRLSLSARRAWIEIRIVIKSDNTRISRSPQGERG